MTKNDLKIVVTSALQPSTDAVADFVKLHGDGVKRFAYDVGAVPLRKPYRLEDADGYTSRWPR